MLYHFGSQNRVLDYQSMFTPSLIHQQQDRLRFQREKYAWLTVLTFTNALLESTSVSEPNAMREDESLRRLTKLDSWNRIRPSKPNLRRAGREKKNVLATEVETEGQRSLRWKLPWVVTVIWLWCINGGNRAVRVSNRVIFPFSSGFERIFGSQE